VPDVWLDLDLAGAGTLSERVRTDARGVARIAITPTDARNGIRGTIRSQLVAAPAPANYVPRRADAARNGQRLAAAATTRAGATVAIAVTPAQVAVSTTAAPATLALGEVSRDTVAISGAFAGWSATVEVRLYGPARTRETISCAGEPAAATTYTAGLGASTTPPLVPTRPGWYGYQLVIPSSDEVDGLTTPCGEASELVKVEAQPTVKTQVSAPAVEPGAAVTDTVAVEGLGGEPVTVHATLHGPYPSADKITCEGPPVWSGSFEAAADGSYVTAPVTLTVPGYYTYRESIAASEFVRAVQTPCAEVAETTIVRGRPQITTQVSALETAPGATITDSVAVSGLGALSATVNVELWGPFPTREAIRCDGTPLATSTLTATGEGTYTSAPTTLDQAGYYTYRETIAATAAHAGASTACGEVAETTFTRAVPAVTTLVSSQVARPGGRISDRIRVTGLGRTPAQVEVELFGPYRSRAAMTCAGAPYWKGTVAVSGDGEVRSPQVRLSRAGFYTYREKIAETAVVAGVRTPCGEETETTLARPLILTGRGERTGRVSAAAAAAPGAAPTRVALRRLGIDAAVYGVDVDTRLGVLDVPPNIDSVGWWRDGAAPGSSAGTILLAGHVDSARRGAGAFYALKGARRGDTITVRTGGTTRSYRVTSLRRVRKAALPTSIYTRTGERRLVLVTCGGPFDSRTKRYRDNVIVTALLR
jgi:LPXTG-site transpeptidase (sortase) family protein